MAFIVLYDACVLYPAPLRDLLVRIAKTGINLADFPDEKLAPYDIEAKHPDDFVLDTIDLAPAAVAEVVSDQAEALKNPPRTAGELLETLRALGLVRSVAKLRELL